MSCQIQCRVTEKCWRALKTRKNGNQNMTVENDAIDFVYGVQNIVKPHIEKLFVHSKYCRGSHVFRASSDFMKHCWRDWAVIDWGDEGHLPCNFLGFLDLSELPDDFSFAYGGIDGIGKGIHGIVETASHDANDAEIKKSELFVPLTKTIGGMTAEFSSHRIFLLADCDAIVRPVAVVPNLGGPQNAYFEIKSRAKWKEDFVSWLEAPAVYDEMSSSDEEDSDVDQENYMMTDASSEEESVEDSEESE